MHRLLIAACLAAMLPMRAAPKGGGAAPAPKSETVDEFVLLRELDNGERQPLLSDSDEEIVQSERREVVKRALKSGGERPRLVVIRRRCTYPLGAKGERLALGSTCEETEV